MTVKEFNEKYEKYLSKGHYGLAINDQKVIEFLDREFKELMKVEGFSYSQIKMKFNSARVYCEPRTVDTFRLENEIEKLLTENC